MADADAHVRPADDVVRRLLQPRRRGRVDLVLGRLGGHRARPARRSSARRSTTRACSRSTSRWPTSGASGSACRCCATSAPSSRCASWRGSSPSAPGWLATRRATGRRGRAGRGAGRAAPHPIGFGPGRAGAAIDAGPARRRPASREPAPFELPAELAIDTDVARRVIGEFIRGQLRQAGFERAVLGLSGGIDRRSSRTSSAEAIGAGAAAVRADAVPDVVAGVAGDAEDGGRRPRLRAASWSTSRPMVDGYFGPSATRDASAARARGQLHGARCGWPSCTTGR